MDKRRWWRRGLWLATAVAAGVGASLALQGDGGEFVLAATRGGGGVGTVEKFEGGALAIAPGFEEDEVLFHLDAVNGTLRVLAVDRERRRGTLTAERNIIRDFDLPARGAKPSFVMIVGNRYQALMNVYVYEAKTGELRVYLYSAKANELAPSFSQTLGDRARVQVK